MGAAPFGLEVNTLIWPKCFNRKRQGCALTSLLIWIWPTLLNRCRDRNDQFWLNRFGKINVGHDPFWPNRFPNGAMGGVPHIRQLGRTSTLCNPPRWPARKGIQANLHQEDPCKVAPSGAIQLYTKRIQANLHQEATGKFTPRGSRQIYTKRIQANLHQEDPCKFTPSGAIQLYTKRIQAKLHQEATGNFTPMGSRQIFQGHTIATITLYKVSNLS